MSSHDRRSTWGIAVLATALTLIGACGDESKRGGGGDDDDDEGGAGGGGEVGGAGGGPATGGSGGGACDPGSTICGGTCVDTSVDPDHCGACDAPCAAGQVCSTGACAEGCSGGLVECDGGCVDTDVDSQHCGGCNAPCLAGEVCSAGQCTLTCGGGTTKCGNECVDTDNDPAHCGACLAPCAAGESCSTGMCSIACGGGTTECQGVCVDIDTDPDNCGGCGIACAPGETCSGSCVCDDPVFGDDDEGTATFIGAIDDCDGSGGVVSGVLDGLDQDWYAYFGVDDVCVVDPTGAPSAGVRVCQFFECAAGGTPPVFCPPGSQSATSPFGLPGCCSPVGQSQQILGLSCSGTDDLNVYVRIDTLNAPMCLGYSLSYHY